VQEGGCGDFERDEEIKEKEFSIPISYLSPYLPSYTPQTVGFATRV
jgi:hypothetical protein